MGQSNSFHQVERRQKLKGWGFGFRSKKRKYAKCNCFHSIPTNSSEERVSYTDVMIKQNTCDDSYFHSRRKIEDFKSDYWNTSPVDCDDTNYMERKKCEDHVENEAFDDSNHDEKPTKYGMFEDTFHSKSDRIPDSICFREKLRAKIQRSIVKKEIKAASHLPRPERRKPLRGEISHSDDIYSEKLPRNSTDQWNFSEETTVKCIQESRDRRSGLNRVCTPNRGNICRPSRHCTVRKRNYEDESGIGDKIKLSNTCKSIDYDESRYQTVRGESECNIPIAANRFNHARVSSTTCELPCSEISLKLQDPKNPTENHCSEFQTLTNYQWYINIHHNSSHQSSLQSSVSKTSSRTVPIKESFHESCLADENMKRNESIAEFADSAVLENNYKENESTIQKGGEIVISETTVPLYQQTVFAWVNGPERPIARVQPTFAQEFESPSEPPISDMYISNAGTFETSFDENSNGEANQGPVGEANHVPVGGEIEATDFMPTQQEDSFSRYKPEICECSMSVTSTDRGGCLNSCLPSRQFPSSGNLCFHDTFPSDSSTGPKEDIRRHNRIKIVHLFDNSIDTALSSHKEKTKVDSEELAEDDALFQLLFCSMYWLPMMMAYENLRPVHPQSLDTFFERMQSGNPPTVEEKMQYEWLRFQSFNGYPQGVAVSTIRLARAGWYYTDNDDVTRCFACGCTHTGWQMLDNPMEVHRRISPNCPFAHGPDTLAAGNIPIHPPESRTTSTAATLSSTPASASTNNGVTPQQTATIVNTGTTSTGQQPQQSLSRPNMTIYEDQTPSTVRAQGDLPFQTASTDLTSTMERLNISSSSSGGSGGDQVGATGGPADLTSEAKGQPSKSYQPSSDRDNTEYRTSADSLAFLSTKDLPSSTTEPRSRRTVETQQQSPASGPSGSGQSNAPGTLAPPTSGQNTPAAPPPTASGSQPSGASAIESPRHPDYSTLDSRIGTYTGWPSYLDQTPRQMSEAGFFYVGMSDFTRCFFCGGGLRNWEPGDNPWVEHTRWYPHCKHILRVKGEKFVKAVLRRQSELLAAQQAQNRRGQDQGPMDAIAVQIADQLKEMGFAEDRIREAIQAVRRTAGHNEVSAEMVADYMLSGDQRQGQSGSYPVRSQPQPQPQPLPQPQQGKPPAGKKIDKAPSKKESKKASSSQGGAGVSLDPEASKDLDAQSLKVENKKLKELQLCKVCMEKNVEITFLPCGHLVCCSECAPAMRKCPICRQNIKGTVKTFMS